MGTDGDLPSSEAAPLGGGRFSWPQLAIWLAVAPILGVVAAWVAVIAQFYFAPLLVFPLLVGVGLGAMLIGLLRVGQIGNRPTLWGGTIVAILVAIAGQHYLSYRESLQWHARQDAETLEKAKLAFPDLLKQRGLEPSAGFADYMRRQADEGRPLYRGYKLRGAAAWASWALDGLLVLIAAVAVMIPAVRQPYCNHCRSWYRTVRGGRIPADAARRVAEVAVVVLTDDFQSARYRLSNCSAGCGPMRLEISWEDPDGSTYLSIAWLEAERRDRLSRTLDHS